MPKNKYTVAVIDNVSPLELAMNAEALRGIDRYTKDFGLSRSNIENNRYGGSKAIVNFLVTEKITAPLYAKGVQVVVATSHVKPPWVNGAPVANKWNMKGADRWQDLSILTVVLVPGDFPPVPTGIVFKEQLGGIAFNPETQDFDTSRRLPERIARCTFKEIKRYLREPADLNDPQLGEKLTRDEYYAYSDEFSKEQLAMVQVAGRLALMEAENEKSAPTVDRGLFESSNELDTDTLTPKKVEPKPGMTEGAENRIKEIYAGDNDMSALDIKKKLGDEGVAVAVADVLKVVKGLKEAA
jgi:hypothetical protein